MFIIRSGYTDIKSMFKDVITDLTTAGFQVKYSSTDKSVAILESGPKVDPLAFDQPWRILFDANDSQSFGWQIVKKIDSGDPILNPNSFIAKKCFKFSRMGRIIVGTNIQLKPVTDLVANTTTCFYSFITKDDNKLVSLPTKNKQTYYKASYDDSMANLQAQLGADDPGLNASLASMSALLPESNEYLSPYTVNARIGKNLFLDYVDCKTDDYGQELDNFIPLHKVSFEDDLRAVKLTPLTDPVTESALIATLKSIDWAKHYIPIEVLNSKYSPVTGTKDADPWASIKSVFLTAVGYDVVNNRILIKERPKEITQGIADKAVTMTVALADSDAIVKISNTKFGYTNIRVVPGDLGHIISSGDMGEGRPCTYTLSVTDRGFSLVVSSNFTSYVEQQDFGAEEVFLKYGHSGENVMMDRGPMADGSSFGTPGHAWFVVQRLANAKTGGTLVDGHSPVVCLYNFPKYTKYIAEMIEDDSDPGGIAWVESHKIGYEKSVRQIIVRESDVMTPAPPINVDRFSDYVNGYINFNKQISISNKDEYIINIPDGVSTQRNLYHNERLDMVGMISANVVSEGLEAKVTMHKEPTPRTYYGSKASIGNNEGMRLMLLAKGGNAQLPMTTVSPDAGKVPADQVVLLTTNFDLTDPDSIGTPKIASKTFYTIIPSTETPYAAPDPNNAKLWTRYFKGGITTLKLAEGTVDLWVYSADFVGNQETPFKLNYIVGSGVAAPPPVTPQKPTISGTPDAAVVAGAPYSFTPIATLQTSFSIQGKPSWATFSVSTGALQGTPTRADIRDYNSIVINANNSVGSTALPAFTLTVLLPLPTISGTPNAAINVGSQYTFVPTITDQSSITIDNCPAWLNFDAPSGILSGTPATEDIGEYTGIVLSAINLTGTTTKTFDISVVS